MCVTVFLGALAKEGGGKKPLDRIVVVGALSLRIVSSWRKERRTYRKNGNSRTIEEDGKRRKAF